MIDLDSATATVAGRFGVIEFFPSDDPIGKALAAYGEWAQAEIDLLSSFVGLGSCVIDIGANVGTHTVALARLVGPTGRVVAFEPQRPVFEILGRNVERNGLSNVTLHNAGVGRALGKMKIPEIDYRAHVNVGAVALVEDLSAVEGDAVSILPIDSLDMPSCHLVKLDAEGMEAEVLAGMADTIARTRPVLFVECNTVSDGIGVLGAVEWSRYQFYLVATSAFNPDNYLKNSSNFFGVARETNLLCVPEELVGITPGPSRARSITPIASGDDLATALLMAPRYGDVTEHDRDPAWLREQLSRAQQELSQKTVLVAQLEERCSTFKQLEGAVADLQNELASERAERAHTAEELEAASLAITRLEFRAASVSKQLEKAEYEARTVSDRLHAAEQTVTAREAQAVALAAEVAALRASTSWRLTRPLRWLRGGRQ